MAVGQVFTAERPKSATVLIVDDEDAWRSLCHDVVTDSALRTRTASKTEQALEILDRMPVDILITDLRVPQIGGLELLKRVCSTYPQTALLVPTQYGTIESAVEATRLGGRGFHHQTVSHPRTAQQAASHDSSAGRGLGKPRAARDAADAAGVRGFDRCFAEDAAHVPLDRTSESACISGADSG
jgi:DNA-binding NtrC family response regulator